MIVTDVLPRPPAMRRRRLVLAMLASLALLAIPAYQAYYRSLGGSIYSGGVFGPTLQIRLDRTGLPAGEQLRGVLVVSAADGAVLPGSALISVYPAGEPMTLANRVATADFTVPSTVPASESITVPFTLSHVFARGQYAMNIELSAQVDRANVHAATRTVATTAFTVD